jgi:ketosteroid isomerase-like protein
MEDAQLLVRRMWTAYREGGTEAALPLLHPDVEFVAVDGTSFEGHDGVRRFFKTFEEQGQTFEASPYSFEGHGQAILVAGHRRIHSADGIDGDYLYFIHLVENDLITVLSAHRTRQAALAVLSTG